MNQFQYHVSYFTLSEAEFAVAHTSHPINENSRRRERLLILVMGAKTGELLSVTYDPHFKGHPQQRVLMPNFVSATYAILECGLLITHHRHVDSSYFR